MPKYRALTGFSYLADEAEHQLAIAHQLAYEDGHRTRVEAGAIVDGLPSWVVGALVPRGAIEEVSDAPTVAPPPPAEAAPVEAEPVPEPTSEPEPVAEPEPTPVEEEPASTQPSAAEPEATA